MLIKQVHQKNVIFVTIGVLKILVLSMNRIFAKVVYIYIKIPRARRDQYTDINIEIHIKTFYELRPDSEICWFAVTQKGLLETYRSGNIFDADSWKQISFGHKYITLAMLNLESIVNFLFFLLHHVLVVCVVLSIKNTLILL